MNPHNYTVSPSWITNPSLLQNVLNHPFSTLKEFFNHVNIINPAQFTSGLRQALYWRRRLAPSSSNHTVIFSFLGPQGLTFPNVSEVCRALRSICNLHNTLELYRASNSSFIGLSFSNPTDAHKVRSQFLYFNNSMVIHVNPSSPLLHDFKITWLPPLFKDQYIHHFLAKYSSSHHFNHELFQIDDNIISPTNTIIGTFELLPDVSPLQIPHLIPLPPPHLGHALLVINGRPPLCIKCRQIGHVRKFCPVTKCSSCKQFHPSSTPCLPHDDISFHEQDTLWFDEPNDNHIHLNTSATTAVSHVTYAPSPPCPNNSQTCSSNSTFLINNKSYSHTTQKKLSPPSLCNATSDSTLTLSNLKHEHSSQKTPGSIQHASSKTSQLSLIKSSPVSTSFLPFDTSKDSPSLPRSLRTTSPMVLHSPLLNTKRITRSMSSLHHITNIPLNTSEIPNSNLAISSGRFHALSDEADSDNDNLDITMISHSCHSLNSPKICLSDHASLSCSQSSLSSDASISDSDKDSTNSTPSRHSKKAKLSKPDSSSFTFSSINLTPASSDHTQDTQVDIASLTDCDVLLPSSSNTTSDHLDSTTTASNNPSTDIPLQPHAIYVHPELCISFCLLQCMKCQTSSRLKWPIRSKQICSSCNDILTFTYEKRFYPHPDKTTISMALTRHEEQDSSNMAYLHILLSTKIVTNTVPYIKKRS